MLNSVTNALRVLEHLVEKGEGGVSEMARALELSPGSVYRLVSTLVESGFAEQNAENRKYRPGAKIFELANVMRGRVRFLDLAHAHLERLVDRAGETVNMGILRQDEVVYVDRVLSSQPLAVEVKIGSHVPAYCTALGKTLLAFGSEDARESYLRRLPDLDPEATVKPTPQDLRAELDEVRARGHAEDNREFSPDIMCVATPVLNPQGQAVAAVSISGPATRFSERKETLIPLAEITGKELTLLVQSLGEDSPRL